MGNLGSCTNDEDFFDGLKESLPPVFTRKVASEMTGGLFSARGLANLDCAGKGPSKKLISGRTVLYERENFIDWLYSTVKQKIEPCKNQTVENQRRI